MKKMFIAAFAALFTVSLSATPILQEPQTPESKCATCPNKDKKDACCKKDKGGCKDKAKKKSCCKNKKAAKKACKKAA